MKKDKHVSISVINRLPRYYRFLGELLRRDMVRISSKELSRLMKVTASQIRQDLNCFGGFGQQGYGYNVEQLHNEIGEILGVNSQMPAVLIGAGNLGKTVANQVQMTRRGFKLVGAFDRDPNTVGKELAGLFIKNINELESFCKVHQPKAAVICVPRDSAEQLADRLVAAGIVGFWNFSSFDFTYKYEHVKSVNMHLGDSLMTLSYMVSHMEDESDDN